RGCRNDEAAIRTHHVTSNFPCLAGESKRLCSGSYIPHFERALGGGEDDEAIIGTYHTIRNFPVWSEKVKHFFPVMISHTLNVPSEEETMKRPSELTS